LDLLLTQLGLLTYIRKNGVESAGKLLVKQKEVKVFLKDRPR